MNFREFVSRSHLGSSMLKNKNNDFSLTLTLSGIDILNNANAIIQNFIIQKINFFIIFISLKNVIDNFCNFKGKFVITIFVKDILLLWFIIYEPYCHLKNNINKRPWALRIKILICRSWEMNIRKFWRTFLWWRNLKRSLIFMIKRIIKNLS